MENENKSILILERKSKIRETLKAINFKIANYDCWIPKKYIINQSKSNQMATIKVQVTEDFVFKLQKYSPQEDFFKNIDEVKQIIQDFNNANKNDVEFNFENFATFDLNQQKDLTHHE